MTELKKGYRGEATNRSETKQSGRVSSWNAGANMGGNPKNENRRESWYCNVQEFSSIQEQGKQQKTRRVLEGSF